MNPNNGMGRRCVFSSLLFAHPNIWSYTQLLQALSSLKNLTSIYIGLYALFCTLFYVKELIEAHSQVT